MGIQIDKIKILEDIDLNNESSPIIKNVSGTPEIISFVRSNYYGWIYVSVVPLNIYENKINYLRRFMSISIIMSIVAAAFVAFLISMRVFKPIRSIMDIVGDDGDDNKLENSADRKSVDEYNYIVSNIKKSLDKNKHMEEELSRRMSMLKSAQTLTLQSQINPHFLHNTLQTINWLAIGLTKGENSISSVIESLSNILRATMETDSYLVPIWKEIEYIKQYIDIQKTRYKDKFDVFWETENSILELMIAKITLQPLVENSIYHGIKPKAGKGRIDIKIYDSDNLLILEVHDDGAGMPAEDIKKLNKELGLDYMRTDRHIGIRNVNQRIKLIFGEKYGITVESGLYEGCKVKIVIPKVK